MRSVMAMWIMAPERWGQAFVVAGQAAGSMSQP